MSKLTDLLSRARGWELFASSFLTGAVASHLTWDSSQSESLLYLAAGVAVGTLLARAFYP
jgi:hypothetical protein